MCSFFRRYMEHFDIYICILNVIYLHTEILGRAQTIVIIVHVHAYDEKYLVEHITKR